MCAGLFTERGDHLCLTNCSALRNGPGVCSLWRKKKPSE